MANSSLIRPWIKPNVIASATYTTTTTSSAFTLPLADCYQIDLVATSVTGTSPTFDAVLQSSIDGGTTYVDLPLRYTQKTAAASESLVFKLGLGGNEVALGQVVADTGGQLAKNCIFDPQYMKIKVTVGGTNPSGVLAFHAKAIAKDQRQGA